MSDRHWDETSDEKEEDDEEDVKEEENDNDTEGDSQKTFAKPKPNLKYPNDPDDPLERSGPPRIRVSESSDANGTITKHQMFWDEGDDEALVTRGEMRKFEQMFWEQSKKGERFWDEESNEAAKAEDLTTRANSELKQIFADKLIVGSEVQLDYKREHEQSNSLEGGHFTQSAKSRSLTCQTSPLWCDLVMVLRS